VTRDEGEAATWFRKAVDQNDELAKSNLAVFRCVCHLMQVRTALLGLLVLSVVMLGTLIGYRLQRVSFPTAEPSPGAQ
jgi:hypothetical protein